jgi:hypothetical protein
MSRFETRCQIDLQVAKAQILFGLIMRFVGYAHLFILGMKPVESVFVIQVSKLLHDF